MIPKIMTLLITQTDGITHIPNWAFGFVGLCIAGLIAWGAFGAKVNFLFQAISEWKDKCDDCSKTINDHNTKVQLLEARGASCEKFSTRLEKIEQSLLKAEADRNTKIYEAVKLLSDGLSADIAEIIREEMKRK